MERYTGSEIQNDFGILPDLMQTFFRNYDATLGRWTGIDPQTESAESLTVYNYSGNNPIMFNDPMGNSYAAPGHSREQFAKDFPFGEYEANSFDESSGGAAGFSSFVTAVNQSANGGEYHADGSWEIYQTGSDAFWAGAAYLTSNNAWGTNGFANSLATAISTYNGDSRSANSQVTVNASGYYTVGSFYYDASGKAAIIGGLSGMFEAVYVGKGIYKQGFSLPNNNNGDESDGGGYSLGRADDWSKLKIAVTGLAITSDKALTVTNGVKLILKNTQTIREVGIRSLKTISNVTGVVNIYNNFSKWSENPGKNWINGVMGVGQVFFLLNPELEIPELLFNLGSTGIDAYREQFEKYNK